MHIELEAVTLVFAILTSSIEFDCIQAMQYAPGRGSDSFDNVYEHTATRDPKIGEQYEFPIRTV